MPFVCSFVFTRFPLPVVLNSGAGELAFTASCFPHFLSCPRLSLSFIHKHCPPYPSLCLSLSPPEECGPSVFLWGELAACSEPLRCQAGTACCQIRPCWLTSPSPPQMPLPASPKLLSHFPFLLTTHGHHLTQNTPTPSKTHINTDFAASILPHSR